MNVQLLQGDCLEVMSGIPDRSIDLVLTDPPYGTTACKWDSIIPLEPMWEQLKRVIKPNGTIVMTATQPFTSKLITSNSEMFKYCLVWEKSRAANFVHANYQPLKCHEDVVVFSFAGAAQGSNTPMTYNPQKSKGKPYSKGVGHAKAEFLSGGNTKAEMRVLSNQSGDRMPRSVIYNKCADGEGKLHPTQKPVALMEYLIKTYSNKGEIVLDLLWVVARQEWLVKTLTEHS